MVFNVKYLGMTLVGQPKGEDMASAAIRRIVAMVTNSYTVEVGAMRAKRCLKLADLRLTDGGLFASWHDMSSTDSLAPPAWTSCHVSSLF